MFRIHVLHLDRQLHTLPLERSLKDRSLQRLIRPQKTQFVRTDREKHKPVRFP